MTDLVMLGAGGHARVLVAALLLRNEQPIGCIAPDKPGADWPAGIAWLGGDDRLVKLDPAGVLLVNGRGSVASTEGRRRLFEHAKLQHFRFANVRHPAAIVEASCREGEGVQVMAGAIVQTGCSIDDNVIVNTGAILDHDCRIGAHAHIATGARLAGGIIVEDGAHIGAGAVLKQGIRVGRNAVVGAGAVVIGDVEADTTVVGNPARVIARRSGTA